MQTPKELKQTYDNSHPDYEHLLNRGDITDKKLKTSNSTEESLYTRKSMLDLW